MYIKGENLLTILSAKYQKYNSSRNKLYQISAYIKQARPSFYFVQITLHKKMFLCVANNLSRSCRSDKVSGNTSPVAFSQFMKPL